MDFSLSRLIIISLAVRWAGTIELIAIARGKGGQSWTTVNHWKSKALKRDDDSDQGNTC
jgi:hypothetical protein